MSSNWEVKKLEEVTINLNSKRIPLSSRERKKLIKKYPYYGAQGIIDYVDNFLFDGEYLLVAEDGENLKSKKQNVANIAKGKFWVNNHAHILLNNELSDLYFLYYCINNTDISGYITGSVQPKLSKANLNAIKLLLPPLHEQKMIANTLKSIDDKIELNNAINKKLEEIAQALFKRWFVDFEFPNENGDPYKSSGGEFEESELGLIPKGWHVSNIGELSKNIQYGYTQSSSVEEIGPKFLRITDIQNGTVEWGNVPFCSVDDKDLKKYRICDHDIFIARTGASTGENIYIIDPPEAVFASYLIRVQFFQPEVAFFIGKCMRRKEYFDYISFVKGGSAQPNANAKTLTSYKVLVPNALILNKYYEKMFPTQLVISNNQKKIQSLTKTRDTLLPKLMSGEIRVPIKNEWEYLQTFDMLLAAESKAQYTTN